MWDDATHHVVFELRAAFEVALAAEKWCSANESEDSQRAQTISRVVLDCI